MLKDTGPASTLETTLRNLTEVSPDLRSDLVGAYFANEGRIKLPQMITDNIDAFTPETIRKLNILVIDEDADVDADVDDDMDIDF